jgi:DnaJ-class molecular chaperone
MGYNIDDFDKAFEKAIKEINEGKDKFVIFTTFNVKVTPTPSNCLHDSCPECHGSGIKANGSACVHFISCPCPKCNPMC